MNIELYSTTVNDQFIDHLFLSSTVNIYTGFFT